MATVQGSLHTKLYRTLFEGGPFPVTGHELTNERGSQVIVDGAVLTGTTAAIGTDTYEFTVYTARRGLLLLACYVVDPVGLTVDVNNYNTIGLYKDSTKLCEADTRYGIVQQMPMELHRVNSVANRTLSAGDTVTLKITGTNSGRIINDRTKLYLVLQHA